MNDEAQDEDLLDLFRVAARERPALQVDEKILQAARQHARHAQTVGRWRAVSAAFAAALLLALAQGWRVQRSLPAEPSAAAIVRTDAVPTAAVRYLMRVNIPVAGSSAVTTYLLNQNISSVEPGIDPADIR